MHAQSVNSARVFAFSASLYLADTGARADTNRAWRQDQQAGLPNLHRVTTNLYRDAQPTAAGLRAAEKLGVKTVISLRRRFIRCSE